jgi:predicted signal transduction protein with EAL and GGDEF domain
MIYIHKADLALYHAKRLGKNRCYIYDNDSEESAEVELESSLLKK